MNPGDVAQLLTSLTEIADVLDKLGVPGLISLFLVGPAFIIATILVLDHQRQKEQNRITEQHREDTQRLIEVYREDTSKMVRDMDEKHAEVSRYYKENVSLTKTTQQLASSLQETIAYNTRVLERMLSVAENNMFCPAARENARGSK